MRVFVFVLFSRLKAHLSKSTSNMHRLDIKMSMKDFYSHLLCPPNVEQMATQLNDENYPKIYIYNHQNKGKALLELCVL